MNIIKRVKWNNLLIAIMTLVFVLWFLIPGTLLIIKTVPGEIADYCYTNNYNACGDSFETINQYLN